MFTRFWPRKGARFATSTGGHAVSRGRWLTELDPVEGLADEHGDEEGEVVEGPQEGHDEEARRGACVLSGLGAPCRGPARLAGAVGRAAGGRGPRRLELLRGHDQRPGLLGTAPLGLAVVAAVIAVSVAVLFVVPLLQGPSKGNARGLHARPCRGRVVASQRASLERTIV